MSVRFERLGPGDKARIAHLALGPGQDAFTADPVARLSALGQGEEAWAVVEGDAIAGFFVLDRNRSGEHPYAGPGEIVLRSLLIDAGQQGRGLGRAAMAALPGIVAVQYPGVVSIVLTVNVRNASARNAYLRAGFRDEGELYLGGRSGPQHVMRLAIPS